MIIVRVELHSAITGKVTELARMMIANDGTEYKDNNRGDYDGVTFRGRDREALDQAQRDRSVTRSGRVEGYPRLSSHVWNLVTRMLTSMGYK